MQSKYVKRDDSIAIAKGLGIIFVVIGHCCATTYQGGNNEWQTIINGYIYAFHMPLFFFLSGYFFKMGYVDNKAVFVKKKIDGLWKPYVKWALLFILLHDALLYIGMYGAWQGEVPEYYSLLKIIKGALAALVLSGGDQLIGGFWFIPVLFFAAIYSMLAIWGIRAFIGILNTYWLEFKQKNSILCRPALAVRKFVGGVYAD